MRMAHGLIFVQAYDTIPYFKILPHTITYHAMRILMLICLALSPGAAVPGAHAPVRLPGSCSLPGCHKAPGARTPVEEMM